MKKLNIKTTCFLFFLTLFLLFNSYPSLAQTQGPSLYERLGGVYSIAAVVDDFIDRLLADPVITANQNVVHAMEKITKPGLKYQVTELLCQAAGGPQKYNGRPMKESHQGLNITEAEWQATMKDFLVTLGKFNIKGLEQNELLVVIGSTKADIVPSAATEQAPLAMPAPEQPAAVPARQPEAPSIIPDLPKPADLIPQIPSQPAIPPSPAAAPAPSIPSIPNPTIPELPTKPVIPSIPDLPKPADLVPQIPPPAAPAPSIPNIPNPAVPDLPSLPPTEPAQGQPFGLPEGDSPDELPSVDPVQPDIAPQDNTDDDLDADIDSLEEELPNPDDIPAEPDLEPVE